MTLDAAGLALPWVERGWVPDVAVRAGIRHLLRARLAEVDADDAEAAAARTRAFLEHLRSAPIALLPELANEQHYELPTAFFGGVLGPHRKYSCGLWTRPDATLADAEAAALAATCERLDVRDGQRILELGCGWGSLSLWLAARHPGCAVTAVSNSRTQRTFIEAEAERRGLANLHVVTADMNAFDTDERYDRVVSVEMFEHLRNWELAFARVARWLRPGGLFLMHVFVHAGAPYAFEPRDASDWMSRHFFSGGMMPSDDLALLCQGELRLDQRWRWDGRHYQKTARAWLHNLDARRAELYPVLAETYGAIEAPRWWARWRLFFLSVDELFGYARGQRWWVSHYRFAAR